MSMNKQSVAVISFVPADNYDNNGEEYAGVNVMSPVTFQATKMLKKMKRKIAQIGKMYEQNKYVYTWR